MSHIPIDGRVVPMKTTSPLHYGYRRAEPKGNSFHQVMSQKVNQGLQSVNRASNDADKLIKQMIIEPDKVDIHDVTIAAQKAQILLDLTKTVLQSSVRGYQSITSLR